jgi:hypothetical protein
VIYESARISSDLVLSDFGMADRIPSADEAPRPLERFHDEVASDAN